MLPRTCSECGDPLQSRSVAAKTCSGTCRNRRSRRIMRERRIEEELVGRGAAHEEITRIVRRESPDVITRVMKEELAPIVREALTEDTLRAIDRMVGLTPAAVAALEEDLGNQDDPALRQRAYTLVMKYTVGHPALVKADDVENGGQLVVNFNLPRPDSVEPLPADAEAQEVRECDMCHEEKPTGEFVADSSRCKVCFEEWRRTITEKYA